MSGLFTIDQAIAVVDSFKHWTIKTKNETGQARRYECTIWGNGRRVSASAKTPLAAIEAAIKKLGEPPSRKPEPDDEPVTYRFPVVG